MASACMSAGAVQALPTASRPGQALRSAAPMRPARAGRQLVKVQNAKVQFNYDTKVFQKELVQ